MLIGFSVFVLWGRETVERAKANEAAVSRKTRGGGCVRALGSRKVNAV